MSGLILAIDQSTQGTKALLFDEKGRAVGRASCAHQQYINEKGWVEHDPYDLLAGVITTARRVCQTPGINPRDIRALGLTNQRETCIAWDRATRKPLHHAIVWQCGRAQELCEQLAQHHPDAATRIRELSGMPLSPYFSAAKLSWLMHTVPEVRTAAQRGTLALGTVDSWLMFQLCDKDPFVTEPSNACRTQLFDIHEGTWSPELCNFFGIPREALPHVLPSNAAFETTTLDGVLPHAVPIHGVLGDSQAALMAQGCTQAGAVKATYGTGSSIMMHTGTAPIQSTHGLISSIAWCVDGTTSYVLEGNLNYTGGIITWLRDNLGLISDPSEVETCMQQANPDDTTQFVPAFTGLGAPWWSAQAQGLFCGITRTTGRNELVRACAESIPYQVADVIQAMRDDTQLALESIRADGGATANHLLMQLQADSAQTEVVVSDLAELSAAGIALLAGKASGLYGPAQSLSAGSQTYYPNISSHERERRLQSWHNAIARATLNPQKCS